MDVRSRSHRSDMAIARFDGEVIDRGDYLVIRTPRNPGFRWGNFLIFPAPPQKDDAERWFAVHAREFPPHADRAVIFAWDEVTGATGDDTAFLARGMSRDIGVCLSATSVHQGPKHDPSLPVRPLTTDADWQSAEQCLIAAFSRPKYEPDSQRKFVQRQLTRYRAMVAAGWGNWFGAFQDERVIGCAGLLRQGEIGRFQLVGTDPDFARQGVCSTLLHAMCRAGLGDFGCKELLIVADATYHARQVYEGIGFAPAERLATLVRQP